MTVGERIQLLRKKSGISQIDFATRINVSKQTLYKYENNLITNIPSDKIEAIASLCHVSPAYLMGWEEVEFLSSNSSYKKAEEKLKRIFSKNLIFYLNKSGKSQKEVANAIDVIPQTFNTWCTGQSIPRIVSIQALADYFGINKSDLIEEKTFFPIESKGDKTSPTTKQIMSNNIKYYLMKNNISQTEMCNALGFKMSTVADWLHARTYPRIERIEAMANYFGVKKSDLIEKNFTHSIESKKTSEKDVAKQIEQLLEQLSCNQNELLFYSELLDAKTRELLKTSLQNSITIAKINTKQKFTSKKYHK